MSYFHALKKYALRSLIILAWIGFLALILYFPKTDILSYDKNTINVFSWGDILDPKMIRKFEMQTGIRVNCNYYASNEELLVKLKATKGTGYDLIVPSDYAVNILSKEHLLKKIDKTKLPFWNRISPNLIGHFFDPYNHYSIPFAWEIYLFGISKEHFGSVKHPTWGMIFDPQQIDYKITMTNDPIEATLFASFYLFGPKSFLTQEEIAQVRALLITQKKWVEAYASFRGDYFLATKACELSVASSSYLLRTLKLFPSSLGVVVPEEGTLLAIENLSIPKASHKEELTYQFINFLFEEESVRSHFETFGFFPSTLQAIETLELDPGIHNLLILSEEQFQKFYFAQQVMPEQQIHDIWIEVKSGKY